MKSIAAAATTPNNNSNDLVILDWKDLTASSNSSSSSSTIVDEQQNENNISQALERAFGRTGLGVVAIRGVPGFVEAKQAFLPMAHQLAHLPKDYLEEKLTDPDSLYNAGWSYGKEKLGDKPDLAKGSFYYNPVTDLPGTEKDRETYPLSYPGNVWPDDEKIPGFQQAAKHIGCILRDATIELTRHLDKRAHARNPDSYPPNFLQNAMKDTEKVKARLLYYFPLSSKKSKKEQKDSWIGWHNDSGFLTALAGEIYVNHETGEIVDCPDPQAGLYIAGRGDNDNYDNSGSKEHHVEIPSDCLAVQMGECTQIVSGGSFCATPHCVRGASSLSNNDSDHDGRIARISLPCFVDTPPTFPLSAPTNMSREVVLEAAVPHPKVPPLAKRWTGNGMTFGDFLQQTFSLYYEWNKS